MTARKTILGLGPLMLLAALAMGCEDDTTYSATDCPSQSSAIEVEGDTYCVFIEEGFLADDCPEPFANGTELQDGVIVCAEDDGDIPREEIKSELEERGLIEEEMQACTEDSDCPDSPSTQSCDGNIATSTPGGSGACVQGFCTVQSEPIAPMGVDCSETGQTCQDGACVGPISCNDDGDCPDEPDTPFCEGDVAVEPVGAAGVCQDGMCTLQGLTVEPTRTDCTQMGLSCREGQCVVVENMPMCEEASDCPDRIEEPYCDGNNAIEGETEQALCEEGQCVYQTVPGTNITDCTETGQTCQGGACVGPIACTEDSQCPDGPGLTSCRGNVAVDPPGATGVCSEGTCGLEGPTVEPTETDCAAQGQVCEDGQCVAPQSCQEDSDCPDDPGEFRCDGNTLRVIRSPAGGECFNNVCGLEGPQAEDIDCTEFGQICRGDICVNNEPECTSDEECPQPVPFSGCEGNTAVNIFAAGFCSEEQTCEIDGEETTTPCGDLLRYCDTGECVEALNQTPSERVSTQPGHDYCDTVDDCVAIYTGCGNCENDCAAINTDLEGAYEGLLNCEAYDGPECDFDCHPDSGLTRLTCENNRCLIRDLDP